MAKYQLYPKYNPETYVSRDLFARVCEAGDLRFVWAYTNAQKWGVEYEPYLAMCGKTCSCCGSELDYGLGRNNHGKKDHETPSTDHKHPQAAGGTNDLENLWIICERCNRMKNNATFEDVERFKRIAQILEESKR
jgi:hypothetical protein